MIEQYFDSSRKRTIAAVLLGVLFTLLYIAILGERPLFIPDETRYGEIAREMLASGDWIVPRLNGLLYFEKPPFGYWLNALSLSTFGENPFAVRFSSALATAVSAGIVFVAGKHFFKSRAIPFLATFIFLTTLEVQAIGTFSVLDPIFAAVLNGGILSMAMAIYAAGQKRVWLSVLAGLLFGLAFLTKGFLAFALPALVLTPWLVLRKDYDFLIRYAWITILFALLTITPWALAIHAREPDFWNYFFWVEHIQRFASENAQHKEPFYYFLMLLPMLAFPWIFLLPTAIRNLRSPGASVTGDRVVLLLALWAALPFVFFSVASGKLATYVLPCFVPFSLIVAAGLATVARERGLTKLPITIAAIAVASFFVVLVLYVSRGEDLVFTADEWLKKAALYGSLILALISLAIARATVSYSTRTACVGLSIVPFMLALPLSMPIATLGTKAPEQFLADTYSKLPTDTIIVSNGSLVRAMSWSTKRDDILVIENGGETTYGLAAPDGAGRFLEPSELERLTRSGQTVLIVCKGMCSVATTAALPLDVVRSSYGNFHAYVIHPQFDLPSSATIPTRQK